MTLRRAAKLPLLIGIAASALVVSVFYVSVYQDFNTGIEETERVKSTLAKTLASRTQVRMQNEIQILELAAKLPQVQSTTFSHLISEEFKGIPPNADPEKRAVQNAIFQEFRDFETVAFLMPNGDVYSVEPSEFQKNLPVVNFAYRDYFIKTTSTQRTYVSEIFRSTATDHNTVVISTPVFRDGALVGVLVGSMNLDVLNKALQTLELGRNEVAVLVDRDGMGIASSERSANSQTKAHSYSYLGNIVEDIRDGKEGVSEVPVNGTAMHVTYAPVELSGNRWAVLLIQPSEDAFSEAYLHQRQAIAIAAIVVAVMGISEYILFRAMLRNLKLADRLEDLNEALKTSNSDLKKEKVRLESLSNELQAKNSHLEYLAHELDLKAEQLQKIDAAKEEFAAMITHELKTPLVPIIGFAELLSDGTLGELTPLQREKVQLMHGSAISLSNLITDLLDIRKLELNKMKFDMIESSVNEFLERAVGSFKPLAESKKISLTYNVQAEKEPNGTLNLICDPKRIQQVLHNLLSNAIKFVPEKTGRIEVSARRIPDDGSIEFGVRDNGIGIPVEKQNEIFKKFYQVDTSLRRAMGGSGLGLAISKGIVEAHGGTIWFESVPGVGTTFYFSIPARPALGNGSNDSK
ncbi:sensor histidine kinase [Nitrososphaera viennensis]|uniref:histidine kinase n=2 Tax=Nitrososphaera viennensis TaxID=1034015 RepID=A0A060HLN9_9ARCH|nr:sensor histidine kinase [Nitrososphaera viennensis]AIC16393.1 putative membrane associated signal transduction histidine kinase, with phosphoacceptor and ATP binding domain [Nitrososphaera viennensis EN76]UVS68327.1 sensor histidine kinase [Nitrososphaera viennensis]